jgi:deazaflavin-dependent oxidoreductase (nitroreductase family)
MASARRVKLSSADVLFNRLVGGLARLGLSVFGTRLLAVRGRKTGAWRTAVVNVLEHEGERYLVAPRGETDWVRNMRAARAGELRLGRRRESFRTAEMADGDKPPVLRAYLARWAFEVRAFFPGVSAESGDAELLRVARNYPIFRIMPAS